MALTKIQKYSILGVSLFLFSICYLNLIFPAMLRSLIKSILPLKKGFLMRDFWARVPFPIGFNIYLFNITNPEEIALGKKPIVQEVGPFSYDMWHEKTNLIDYEDDDTVSYTSRNTHYFNSEASGTLTGEEELIIPNPFILGFVNTILRTKPTAMPLLEKAIQSIFRNPDSIFVKMKVNDILYRGYVIDCNVEDFAGALVCNIIKGKYEDLQMTSLGNNRFSMSLFGEKNGTSTKNRLRVHRGFRDLMEIGVLTEYNEQRNMTIWKDKYCDTFHGTDGTIFYPFFDKYKIFTIFNPMFCRSINCYYESKSEYAGMSLLRYTADMGIDAKNNPEHKCYCQKEETCLKKGVFDTFECLGAPLIVSNPHFYLADPYYLSTVEGLKPIKEKHMVVLDLDPFFGAPVYGSTKVQINMFLQKVDKFSLMKDFPDALLPLLWMEEVLILPEYFISAFKISHKMFTATNAFSYVTMITGLGFCGYAAYMYYMVKRMVTVQSTKNIHLGDVSKPKSGADKILTKLNTMQPGPV